MARGARASPSLLGLESDARSGGPQSWRGADDGTELLGSIDQLYHAVVAGAQIGGQFLDAGAGRVGMTSDRQQKLVLGRGEPHLISGDATYTEKALLVQDGVCKPLP